jgi:hypothetical protein
LLFKRDLYRYSVGHCIEPDRPRATAGEIKRVLGVTETNNSE